MSNNKNRKKTPNSHPSPVNDFPQVVSQEPKVRIGKTSTGFAWRVNPLVLDNMELVELLADMKNDDDPLTVPKLCDMILGRAQKQQLYEFVRTPDGRVPISAVSETIMEIFQALGSAGKNS